MSLMTYSACFLIQPRGHLPLQYPRSSRINLDSAPLTAYRQCDRGILVSVEVSFSQMTPACVELTKTNQNREGNMLVSAGEQSMSLHCWVAP